MKLRLEVAAIFTMRHSYQSSHFYYAKRKKEEHLATPSLEIFPIEDRRPTWQLTGGSHDREREATG